LLLSIANCNVGVCCKGGVLVLQFHIPDSEPLLVSVPFLCSWVALGLSSGLHALPMGCATIRIDGEKGIP
jgi:hypothetical protein